MMDVTRQIQIAIVQVDMALCAAGRAFFRVLLPALIVAALLLVSVVRRR